jgi:hypothetical protein
MPLTLTPATPVSLTLTPVTANAPSYLIQANGGHILLGNIPGAIIISPGVGLSLVPIVPGSLTLTPDPTS